MRLTYDDSTPLWLIKLGREMTRRKPDITNRQAHVTQLLQPAPKLALEEQYWDDLNLPADDLIPALLGNAWHKYLENAMGPNGYAERTMEVSHQDASGEYWDLIGTPDWFNREKVIDFKSTRAWSAIFGKPEWEEQLNVYRWLIWRATGIEVETMEIHAIYTDWTANAARRNPDYPQKRWEVIEVPAWGHEKTRSFINARLEALAHVEPDAVCTEAERWERGECWAVMKKGRKSAMPGGLMPDPDSAKAMAATITGAYVEHRPGNPVRCKQWCSVREYCAFGKTLEASDE